MTKVMTGENQKKADELRTLIENHIQKLDEDERRKETPQHKEVRLNKNLLLDYTNFLKTSHISITSTDEFIYNEYLKIHKNHKSYYHYRNKIK